VGNRPKKDRPAPAEKGNEVQMPDDEKRTGTGPTLAPDADQELAAMSAIVTALTPLQDEQRTRVLEYVLGRFGGAVAFETQFSPTISATAPVPTHSNAPAHTSQIQDIRSLKEEKNPRSANEMAVLVAYYVSEIAPASERKNTITKADIEKYFKSAGFRLPADASFTLVNTKNAGYLESVGGGQYKLNPVGYNLVALRMGMGTTDRKQPRRKR
jgi:hypothetical protein